MDGIGDLTRRATLAAMIGAAAVGRAAAQALGPPGAPSTRRLVFAIWRNGQIIGEHQVAFQGGAADFTVETDASLLVKVGPIPVFHQRHQALETWRDGRFADFRSTTVSNGRREQVTASRTAAGVVINTPSGRTLTAAADALPLTHWSLTALSGPLFNPQTGALLRTAIARQPAQIVQLANGQSVDATRYTFTGDAQISDWYDPKGVWTALRAKVVDGSTVDYRRTV